MQAANGGLVERDWQGIVHWKTWALAGLDVCISTVKCACILILPPHFVDDLSS